MARLDLRDRWRSRGAALSAALALAAGAGGCADYGQTETCGKFVACVRAIDLTRGTTTNLARFEASGGCWGGKPGTELCDGACSRGLEHLRRAEPALSLPECK